MILDSKLKYNISRKPGDNVQLHRPLRENVLATHDERVVQAFHERRLVVSAPRVIAKRIHARGRKDRRLKCHQIEIVAERERERN